MLDKIMENSQKALLTSLIYYMIAVENVRTIEKLIKILEYDLLNLKKIFGKLPVNHIAVVEFNKVKNFEDKDLYIILNELKTKVLNAQKIENIIPDFHNEVEVEIYVQNIVENNLKTVEEYTEYLNKIEDVRGLFVIGFKLFYHDEKIELGLKCMIDSANKGNNLALYYLGKIYFEGKEGKLDKDYKTAEEYLKQFIEKEKR